jgi:histidine ammonia-lyase
MVSQYTAAALVSENKVLSHPASVDSISVSADQEDHVSMGPIAVRKCTEILKNVRTVLAIEMMAAAQAFEFQDGRKPGKGTSVAYDVIRSKVPKLVDDRVLYPDIEAIRLLLEDCSILDAVEAKIGPLSLARDMDLPKPNVPA